MRYLSRMILYPFSKVAESSYWLYSFLFSIWFNYTFLPLHQARKMPIWIVSVRFYKLRRFLKTGQIVIDSDHINNKMIKLGVKYNSWNPHNGTLLQVYGRIVFKGTAVIGNNSTIYVANGAEVIMGNNFNAASGFTLICQKKIMFGEDTLIGWNSQFTDTDFHNLYNADDDIVYNRKAPIIIGKNNWFGCHTMVFKGFKTNDDVVISAGSICKKRLVMKKKSVIGNSNELETLSVGTYYEQDKDASIDS